MFVFFVMIRRPPISTRTDSLFPYTTLFRSLQDVVGHLEGIREGGLLVGNPEQVLVRDDDQGVDVFLQLADAGLGQPHALATLERERLGHDTNRKDTHFLRSDERRVGKECVSTCRSRWSPYH